MKIYFKSGRNGKVSVFCGEDFLANVDADFALTCGVKNEEELTEERLADFCESVGLRSAFLGAVRMLAVRDHSKKELIQKLCQKGHSRHAAEGGVSRAEELGLLDDESYARSLARRLSEGKGWALPRIRYELSAKGISREIADKVLCDLDNQPVLRIIEMLNTKYSRNLNDEKGVRRTVNALQRMGYRYSDIRSALSEFQISCESEDM